MILKSDFWIRRSESFLNPKEVQLTGAQSIHFMIDWGNLPNCHTVDKNGIPASINNHP
tara:strand:- start:31247 stop:31420 length:174 start_codon:yes stop_codon:yes gene_type:complete